MVYRALWILPLMSVLCLAADNSQKQEKKPVVDSSNMSSDVHAPLFQGPKTLEAGSNTERLASGLPKPLGPVQKVPRLNFIDNHIFGKMERDRVWPFRATLGKNRSAFVVAAVGDRRAYQSISPLQKRRTRDNLLGANSSFTPS